jgi:hypothetical protein
LTVCTIPLVFAPGEAYQFDWSYETVEFGGQVAPLVKERKHGSLVPFYVIRLPETWSVLRENSHAWQAC